MDILKAREDIRYRSLKDLPLRVAYYARVSTEKDEQLNSLKNQRLYYEEYITSNRNWVLVNGYIDEGISGVSIKKRENFHRMIDDAIAGKFDFIITKEISRFARNTLDSIHYTRLLLSNGVAVLFENDNINTLDEDSEFRLTIMAGVAQDEIRKLSSRIKFGHKQAIKNGVVMGNSRIYGYEKEHGRLVINESEAEMVRLIFQLYSTGEYSTPKLEKLLWDRGYRSYSGKKISRAVIGHIITNPKYKGFYVGNKVKIVDMFTKKQRFLSQDEWVMWKDTEGGTVPAIIDEATWEKANLIFNRRSSGIKSGKASYKSDNLFTGKLYCAEHNVPFYLKARTNAKGENNGIWRCSHKIKNGADSCETFSIKETELIEIVTDLLTDAYNSFDELAELYLQFYKESKNDSTIDLKLKELEEEIAHLNARKDKLLDLSLDGKLTNTEFGIRNNRLNDDIAELEHKKRDLLTAKSGVSYSSEISKLKEKISSYFSKGQLTLTQGTIDDLIERIYVHPKSSFHAELEIILKTGAKEQITLESAKSPEKAMCRSVNTFKKMIEAQEKHMAGK